jgi:hypothetical protein
MSLAGHFSNDLHEFSKQIVWFDGPERRVSDTSAFLAFIMAKSVPSAYEHAKMIFGFTNEDFRNALKAAKPGLFVYSEQWERWNKILGIEPSLPFPVKWPERFKANASSGLQCI